MYCTINRFSGVCNYGAQKNVGSVAPRGKMSFRLLTQDAEEMALKKMFPFELSFKRGFMTAQDLYEVVKEK